MKKHYFTSGRGIFTSLLLIFVILFSGIGQVFGQLLDPLTHPMFVTPLPLPTRIDATNGGNFEMSMEQTTQHLGLFDAMGNPLNTTVWGYGLLGQGVTYPGPTFEAKKDVPVNITWHNNLPASGHILPTDVSLHMAHPDDMSADEFYGAGYIPAVTHLHGGHTESGSDGLPEAWYTQEGLSLFEGNFNVNGNAYHYDNDQESATLWYHDHALGITRLNVYAGLAGFYLLTDDNEKRLRKNNIIPKNSQNIEIVIQDRMFYSSGELFLPAKTGDPWFGDEFGAGGEPLELPKDPSIVAEFFGNFIIVNGVAWPNYRVQPRKYRFRMLNGSDSRFYVLQFDNGMSFLQIGTDDGFLNNAIELNELILAPGERADIIVDFTDHIDANIILTNRGPDEPFKGDNFNNDLSRPTGQIMQFSVDKKLNNGKKFKDATVTAGTSLRLEAISELTPTYPEDDPRKLALFEGEDADGRLQPLLGVINGDNEKGLGGVLNGSLAWFEDITENPDLDEVEVWEVYNTTEDAHPMHLHLVSFQILGRYPINEITVESQDQEQHDGRISENGGAYVVESSIVLGAEEDPASNEQGWKDTFIVPPGYMGKVIAKFDRPGRYVWHCHILSHEDHEMMRPYFVGSNDELLASMGIQPLSINQIYPNPFYSSTAVDFTLNTTSTVTMTVSDENGDIVWTETKQYDAGDHTFSFDATGLLTGTYYFQLTIGSFTDSQRMFIL